MRVDVYTNIPALVISVGEMVTMYDNENGGTNQISINNKYVITPCVTCLVDLYLYIYLHSFCHSIHI